MGQQLVYVDAAALRAAADRFDTSAEFIASVARARLGRLGFSAVSAGRLHAAGGEALRRTLDRWTGELAQWSRASAEIAAALRVNAESYAEAELRATTRVG